MPLVLYILHQCIINPNLVMWKAFFSIAAGLGNLKCFVLECIHYTIWYDNVFIIFHEVFRNTETSPSQLPRIPGHTFTKLVLLFKKIHSYPLLLRVALNCLLLTELRDTAACLFLMKPQHNLLKKILLFIYYMGFSMLCIYWNLYRFALGTVGNTSSIYCIAMVTGVRPDSRKMSVRMQN